MGQCGLYDGDRRIGRVLFEKDGLFMRFQVESEPLGAPARVVLLSGDGGALPLGVLAPGPEGGAFEARKKISVSSLARLGLADAVWERAELSDGGAPRLPADWRPAGEPDGKDSPIVDAVLREALRGAADGLWVFREDGLTRLAAVRAEDRPCPLAPAFCLLEARAVSGRLCYLLTLDGSGWPILPNFVKP